jgi:hypothetical protein
MLASLKYRYVPIAILVAVLEPGGLHSAGAAESIAGPINEAADAFDRAIIAYKNSNWVTAAEQFELADSQVPSAEALEYAIRSWDRAGQMDRAATLAKLARDRSMPSISLQRIADWVLERAEGLLFAVTAECRVACNLEVDGKTSQGEPSQRHVFFLNQGDHVIVSSLADGRSQKQVVRAFPGKKVTLRFGFANPTSGDSLHGPRMQSSNLLFRSNGTESRATLSSGWSPSWFWIGVGMTALAAGATTWSAIDTYRNPGTDRVRNECAAGDTQCPVYQEGLAHQRRTNVLAVATGGLGAATTVVGLFATDFGGSAEKPPATPSLPTTGSSRARHSQWSVRPYLSLGGCASLAVGGRF